MKTFDNFRRDAQKLIEAQTLAGNKGVWLGHGNNFPKDPELTAHHYGYRKIGSNRGATVYGNNTGHTLLMHSKGWTHIHPGGKQTNGHSPELDHHLFRLHGAQTESKKHSNLKLHEFLTRAECIQAYHEGIRDGTIGKCSNCGSPNLSEIQENDCRECVDCGNKDSNWRITEDEEIDFQKFRRDNFKKQSNGLYQDKQGNEHTDEHVRQLHQKHTHRKPFWMKEDELEEEKSYYHGTSSNHLEHIKKHGLTGEKIYVTPSKQVAAIEAHNTVHGDYGGDKHLQGPHAKKGIGGHPVILHIHQHHIKNLTRDPEYPENEPAYYTHHEIPKHGIHKIEHFHHADIPKWVHSYWKGDEKHYPTEKDLTGVSEAEGMGGLSAGATSAGTGNIAGIGVGPQGEPGVSPEYQRKRHQLELVGPPAVDPRMFADKIFGHSKTSPVSGK